MPASDLTLKPLIPNQIITIPQFWTQALCKTYVTFLQKLPLKTTPGEPKKGDALRVNDRYQVLDERFANTLWEETGLRDLICGSEELETEGMTREERKKLWFAMRSENEVR
jgi:hypothetical protein